jgi:hypothetical protein
MAWAVCTEWKACVGCGQYKWVESASLHLKIFRMRKKHHGANALKAGCLKQPACFL